MPQINEKKPTFSLLKRGAVTPGAVECEQNPRARSAKLRAALRSDAPAGNADRAIFKLADFSGVTELSKGYVARRDAR
jgi:16S rRNA (cytosine1402-N4)-methyltransferase